MSLQRVMKSVHRGERIWVGPNEATPLKEEEQKAYTLAEQILCHLAVQAPVQHKSGHPGGPLSAFTFAYCLSVIRDPAVDQPLRMSAGHLSLLSYGLQWLFGREGSDKRLASPQAIIDTFRTPSGLPGHIEAGIGDIPFGTGPLGKGLSNALGAAFGLQYLRKLSPTPYTLHPTPIVDVLLADGDSQEGQVMEAVRLAAHLKTDNLIVHGDFNDVQLSGLPSETVAADFASIVHAAGWHVIEVQNGNDPAQVQTAIEKATALTGKGHPIFVCYYTTMGNGIPLMEEGSNTGRKNYHGAPLSKDEAALALKGLPPLDEITKAYDPFRAQQKKRTVAKPRVETDLPLSFDAAKLKGYTRTITEEKGAARRDFGATHLKNLMKADPRIMILHADLAGSGGFDEVAKAFPDRVINVGVAEANMLMMAAGMRQVGLLPVTYTFAAFGTNEARANARLIDINCGHTRCGILNDCTHAGLSVGEDGETHQEQNYFNLPFRSTQVWMPVDSNQAAAMAERAMELIAEGHQSVFVFSPRTGHAQLTDTTGKLVYGADYTFDGKAERVRGSGDVLDQVTIIATGIPVHRAVEAADLLFQSPEKIRVRVLNVGSVRPIDAAAVLKAALETGRLIVAEDHNSEGGLAAQVADIIADFALPCSLRRLGLNQYFPSAKAEDLELMAGLDTESILHAALDEIHAEVRGGEDAFVSALFEMAHHLHSSRFRETALPFVEKLLTEKGYLALLRTHFARRACPPGKLPKNDQLLERLQEGSQAI
ncbi:MAG: transketolase C-terminal domain-containing protein [Candidatus Peribacteraceae bacterium]|nr:transketolase C-terminal domain-containing protein [Candidatus Peribacteraceae bacterium]MDD5742447.1 transketolase C-terminal domain-containing protein [Candidatus Peribacteraceae bacterium]